MSSPDFEQARRYALERLERELHPALCYHSVEHTRDDVAPASERIALQERVSGENLLLVQTAAYFHDLGMVERRAGHEELGAQYAAEVLPGFGYSPAQVVTIREMILATRLPQRPQTLLAAILADSDLDVLGRPDFLNRNLLLRAELAVFDPPATDLEWYSQQISFLQTHRYWTASARANRDAGKVLNLRVLEGLLAAAQMPAIRQR